MSFLIKAEVVNGLVSAWGFKVQMGLHDNIMETCGVIFRGSAD